jgi:hypothetical protein
MGDARPYMGASADAVRAGAWRLVGADRDEPLSDWLAAWDLSLTLHARRQVEVDLDRVFKETQLPSGSRLVVSVVYTSEFEDEAWRISLDDSTGVVPLEIDVELDGPLLGSSLTLNTSLVLAENGLHEDRPVAWRRGSVLWQDPKRIRLYGDSSQFPLMEVDFVEFNLDPAAPWFVQVGADLNLPAMGSILLLLNDRFPLVTEAAKEFEADRPELKVIRSMLYADVARTLVEVALGHDDLLEEWPDDSLGDVLATLVQSRFNDPPHELRQLRDQDPAAWDALVAARFGLLREPLR